MVKGTGAVNPLSLFFASGFKGESAPMMIPHSKGLSLKPNAPPNFMQISATPKKMLKSLLQFVPNLAESETWGSSHFLNSTTMLGRSRRGDAIPERCDRSMHGLKLTVT